MVGRKGSINKNKLFFIQEDIDKLEAYNHQLDDEFKSASSAFFDISYKLMLSGFDRAENYYTALLAEPLDFTVEESTWNNPEKISWAKDEKQLQDYWRRYVKWRVANRIYNKEHAVLEDIENGEEVDEYLHGMPARIWQHENEHMNGYVFTDLVSKFKLERAEKSRMKMIKDFAKGGAIR